MKVEKDNIIKDIDNEALLADYISAGWKIVNEKKVTERKPIRTERIFK